MQYGGKKLQHVKTLSNIIKNSHSQIIVTITKRYGNYDIKVTLTRTKMTNMINGHSMALTSQWWKVSVVCY